MFQKGFFLGIFFTSFIYLTDIIADEKSSKITTIPVLDLTDYFNKERSNIFIQNIRDALHNVGFFALKNTGVNKKVLKDLYVSMETFFAYDKEKKMSVSSIPYENQRGYTYFGEESAKGSNVADYKEYYAIGRSYTKKQAETLNVWPNIWPMFMNFKDPAEKYFSHLEEYSILIQEILSLALGEEKDFLQKICKDGDTSSRMIHYPYVKEDKENEEEILWCGEHTDIGLFTILPKPTAEGLELCNKEGKWINVYAGEDTFIVNAGDLLEIFSNGYFRSTLHRVVKPKSMKEDRYSLTMFVHPKSEAIVYPLKRWINKTGGKQRYVVATRYEMLMERLADNGVASNAMLKQLAASKLLERLIKVNRASKEAIQAVYDAGYASNELKEYLKKIKE